MFSLLIITLALSKALSAAGDPPCVPEDQWHALQRLHAATDGAHWDWRATGAIWNFTADLVGDVSDPCLDSWQGVACEIIASNNSSSCEILNITLRSYNLNGAIPLGTFGNLTTLHHLDLSSNALGGPIPSDIGLLSELVNLDLGNNSLSSVIPVEIGNMLSLQSIILSKNQLSGPIPSSIGAIGGLTVLSVSDNLLNSRIPEEFVNLINITVFMAKNNSLSGPFPENLLSLRKLRHLGLGVNKLSGPLPRVAEWSAALSLQTLQLGYNRFTGPVPSEIGLATSLVTLEVAHNDFDRGSIPRSFYDLVNLELLIASSARFSGSISSSIGYLRNLSVINLNDNDLAGTLPSTLSQLTNLEMLLIHNNNLNGALREELFDPTKQLRFQALDLSGNQLTGGMPNSLFKLPFLKSVALAVNCLSDKLPDSICGASFLEILILDGLTSASHCSYSLAYSDSVFITFVDGDIPSCLFDMPSLNTLHVSGNGLHGTLPEVTDKSVLKDLSMSYNIFTGDIPASLQHTALDSLDLGNNKITGGIKHIQPYKYLRLVYNRLSGGLPSNLNNKTYFTELEVLDGNKFQCTEEDLPRKDPSYSSYTCDASEIEVSLYTCMGSIGAVAMVAAFVTFMYLKAKAELKTERSEDVSVLHRTFYSLLDRLYDFVANLIQYYIVGTKIMEPHSRMPKVRSFMMIQNVICNVVIVIVVFVVFVNGPIYVCLKLFGSVHAGAYPTYKYQNNWLLSLVYLAGPAAMAVVMVLWVILLVLLLFLSPLMVIVSEISLRTRVESNVVRESSVSVMANIEGSSDFNFQAMRLHQRFRIDAIRVNLLFILFLAVNGIIVVVVNILYVGFANSNVDVTYLKLVQIAMGMFRLGWNVNMMKVISYMERNFDQHLEKFSAFFCIILIFNNIIVPCVASGLSDLHCLETIFNSPDEVTVEYSINICTEFVGASNTCVQSRFIGPFTLWYTPPFIYHYDCMSSLMSNYIPVLLYTYVFLGFIYPAAMIFISALDPARDIPSWTRPLFPHVVWPYFSRENLSVYQELFPASKLLVLSLSHVAVLFTFGIASPPLALSIAVSVVASVKLWRMLIGRYVIQSPYCNFTRDTVSESDMTSNKKSGGRESVTSEGGGCPEKISCNTAETDLARLTLISPSDLAFKDISGGLESACDGCQSGYLICILAIVFVSGIFYGFVFFDMIGDANGYKHGAIAFSLTTSVPFLLFFILWLVGRSNQSLTPDGQSPLSRITLTTSETLHSIGSMILRGNKSESRAPEGLKTRDSGRDSVRISELVCRENPILRQVVEPERPVFIDEESEVFVE